MKNAKTKTWKLLIIWAWAILVRATVFIAFNELLHMRLVRAPLWLARPPVPVYFLTSLHHSLICNALYHFGFSQENQPNLHAQLSLEHANSTNFHFDSFFSIFNFSKLSLFGTSIFTHQCISILYGGVGSWNNNLPFKNKFLIIMKCHSSWWPIFSFIKFVA